MLRMSMLHRHRNLLDFALSSLARRKGRTAALLLVYTLLVAFLASLVLYVQALKREAAILLAEAPELVVQRVVAGRQDLVPLAWTGPIADLPGVAGVEPRGWGYYYEPVTGANFTVMVRAPEDGLQEGAAILGPGVARALRVQAGDFIPLQTVDHQPLLLSVASVLPASTERVSADLLIVTPPDFQALFALPETHATDLAVRVGNPRELETLAGKIAAGFPGARPILRREMLRTYAAIFDWRGGLVMTAGLLALAAFLILAWDRASGLSADERREIGILKSLGWDTADVLLLKLWEGAAVSLSAFLGGLLLAYAHVFLFGAAFFEPALRGWSVIFARQRLLPEVDPFSVAVLFLLVVAPYTLATVVPSWRSASADPDAAMRS
jgi:ABC-type lipoprotein release transport system permease subunit